MVFSSIAFVCAFLPCVYALYCIVPKTKIRNAILIIASLVFYSYGEPVYILVLLASWLVNYSLARAIEAAKQKKAFLVIDVVANIALLVVFKYAGFIAENLNLLPGVNLPDLHIIMPIGISFFTFQTMSYVIDVYEGTVRAQKNPAKVLLYISFFPQLIAGPIVKYRDISEQIDNRKITLEDAAYGMRRFIVGLSKKVLIADTMAVAADGIYAATAAQMSVGSSWLFAVCYMLQIYYDFSGYSDMAIGMGRMFGFRFKENFNLPYAAAGMKDFWKRWHISLTDWFREYLYIPLGGNRKGKTRTSVNKVIVFLLTGFWHGANWTFIVWGLFHAFFQLLEDYFPKIKKLPRPLLHIYTLLVVCIGFVIFRADTLSAGVRMIGGMFGAFPTTAATQSFFIGFLNPWFITILIAAVLGAGVVQYIKEWAEKKRTEKNDTAEQAIRILSFAVSVLLLVVCVMQLAGSTYHPFIYFRF